MSTVEKLYDIVQIFLESMCIHLYQSWSISRQQNICRILKGTIFESLQLYLYYYTISMLLYQEYRVHSTVQCDSVCISNILFSLNLFYFLYFISCRLNTLCRVSWSIFIFTCTVFYTVYIYWDFDKKIWMKLSLSFHTLPHSKKVNELTPDPLSISV